MIAKVNNDWQEVLKDEFHSNHYKALEKFIAKEYSENECYPPQAKIFAALNNCPFNDIKVVILGQDPYPTPNVANGLCFSVSPQTPIPASLKNIYTEIGNNLNAIPPVYGDLSHWANQGVLLLNSILTVRAHEPGSHKKQGWEQFTNAVIKNISERKEHVVFMLWGSYAKKKGAKVDNQKHCILESGHPSPLSANRGFWFGNNHFNLCNEYLKKHKLSPIKWIDTSL